MVSQLVLDEAAAGDPDAAQRRAVPLEDLPLAAIDTAVIALATELIEKLPLPNKAGADAVHIAAATCEGVDFLLTWNCAHIANAELRPGIEKICREQGYAAPVLCTPDELMGEAGDD